MKLSSLLLCAALLTGAAPLPAGATDGHVCFATNPATGAIASLSLAGDTTNMNWMLRTDGSQYAWVTPKYGWGLGYFSIDGCTFSWQTPTALADGGRRVEYVAGGVRIEVERSEAEGGFAERFTFVNEGAAPVRLTDMGIYTPFNDNYPDARTCLTERCHAHIWPGGAAAYVEAQRMSGRGSEVGLMLTQGNVVDYDIWERGPERANSNFRGVVALCPADTTLGAATCASSPRTGGPRAPTWPRAASTDAPATTTTPLPTTKTGPWPSTSWWSTAYRRQSFGTPRPEAAGRALLQGKRRQRATGKSIFFVILHPKHLSTTKKTC